MTGLDKVCQASAGFQMSEFCVKYHNRGSLEDHRRGGPWSLEGLLFGCDTSKSRFIQEVPAGLILTGRWVRLANQSPFSGRYLAVATSFVTSAGAARRAMRNGKSPSLLPMASY